MAYMIVDIILLVFLAIMFFATIAVFIFVLRVTDEEFDKGCTRIKIGCKYWLDEIWRKLKGN